jgi:DNA (cytosine-5)-methyltransferase 1
MKKPLKLANFPSDLTCIEICSGAGGQALGLERAGFEALAHVEYDRHACATLRLNRPNWNVVEGDVRSFSAKEYKRIVLFVDQIDAGQKIEGDQPRRISFSLSSV